MKKENAVWLGHGAIGLALPWLLCLAPLPARLGGALASGLLGTGLLLGARRARASWLGAWWGMVAVATLWIALASYSAELSKHIGPMALLFVLALAAPPAAGAIWNRWRRRTPAGPPIGLYGLGAALLALAVLGARPARRYEMPRRMEEIKRVGSVQNVHESLQWVALNIERKRAPFTDNARDTLLRGQATCGGMANLLHKLILVQEIAARIVHFADDTRIHTLVEYRDPRSGKWVLADPDKQWFGPDWYGLSGQDVVLRQDSRAPEDWQGYDRLYVYVEGRGYMAVTPDNEDDFY